MIQCCTPSTVTSGDLFLGVACIFGVDC